MCNWKRPPARIVALEAVEPERVKGREAESDASRGRGSEREISGPRPREQGPGLEPSRAPKGIERQPNGGEEFSRSDLNMLLADFGERWRGALYPLMSS